jgi:hypothetical protein
VPDHKRRPGRAKSAGKVNNFLLRPRERHGMLTPITPSRYAPEQGRCRQAGTTLSLHTGCYEHVPTTAIEGSRAQKMAAEHRRT